MPSHSVCPPTHRPLVRVGACGLRAPDVSTPVEAAATRKWHASHPRASTSLAAVGSSAGLYVFAAVLLAYLLGTRGFGPWWIAVLAVIVIDAYGLRVRQTLLRARSAAAAAMMPPAPVAPLTGDELIEKEWQLHPSPHFFVDEGDAYSKDGLAPRHQTTHLAVDPAIPTHRVTAATASPTAEPPWGVDTGEPPPVAASHPQHAQPGPAEALGTVYRWHVSRSRGSNPRCRDRCDACNRCDAYAMALTLSAAVAAASSFRTASSILHRTPLDIFGHRSKSPRE